MVIFISFNKLCCKFPLTIKNCLHYIFRDISRSRWGWPVNIRKYVENKVGLLSVN
jgi:hypothetical protein